MGLVRLDKWAPSKRPYALDRNSFPLKEGGVSISALWAGRKRGKTIVSVGTLDLWHHNMRYNPDLGFEEIVSKVDMRYGGNWRAQWDGELLLVAPYVKMTPEQQVKTAEYLDEILKNFPEVPAPYEGWYYRD